MLVDTVPITRPIRLPTALPSVDGTEPVRQVEQNRIEARRVVPLDPPGQRGPLGTEARKNLFMSGVQDAEPEKSATGLTPEEETVVKDLKARDAEVRRHEQAHAAVGGQYAGSPSYTFQTGPDGNRYAIGGEVAIDVSTIPGDPEATIQKMEQVKAAALAPAEPSAADRSVAALADAQRMAALAELNAMRRAPDPEEARAGFSAAREAFTPPLENTLERAA